MESTELNDDKSKPLVSENETDTPDMSKSELLSKYTEEKESLEYELQRKGAVNNYKIDRMIDLYFLIKKLKQDTNE